jgi:hypothetical protein
LLRQPALHGRAHADHEGAIYTIDQQAFHHIPDGLPRFERLPKM